jgi:hypothetical protein
MTQPLQPQQPTVYVQAQPSNGLGIAGFITSLVGLITCGLLCPIGLLLSLIAIFKRPRGFAIAGLIIGLVGTAIPIVIFLIWGIGILAAIGFASAVGASLQTYQSISNAESRIHSVYVERSTLPADADGTNLIDDLPDQWGHAMRYHQLGASRYEIRSAGSDGIFNTSDDITQTYSGSDSPSSSSTTE